jgi:LysR family glycine cleavage system transcriptional activator
LALEEAKAGAGLLMGHACLVEDALTKGDLVRPFPQDYKTGKSLILKAPSTKDVGFDLERLVYLLG